VLILVAIVRAYMDYQAKYQLSRVFMSGTQKMKVDLYSACLDLDLGEFQKRTSANLMARMSQDVNRFKSILSTSLSQSLRSPIEILCYFVVLLILSFKITLITIVAMPLLVAPLTLLSKKLRNLTKQDAEEDAFLM